MAELNFVGNVRRCLEKSKEARRNLASGEGVAAQLNLSGQFSGDGGWKAINGAKAELKSLMDSLEYYESSLELAIEYIKKNKKEQATKTIQEAEENLKIKFGLKIGVWFLSFRL